MEEKTYKENETTRELKSEIAKEKIRDSEGHFIHTERSEVPSAVEGQNPISQFLSQHSHYDKTQDDLLDVHVGNPLQKIVTLLQDIKKQKAFSFTLKGSLGITGVALALGVFGVFGTGQILCDKGVQSEIGTIKILSVKEEQAPLPVIGSFISLIPPISPISQNLHNRIVLIKNNETVIFLFPTSPIIQKSLTSYNNYPIIATGNYDSCSQTLTINNANGLEIYSR